jgi:hypothetical protein
VWAENDEPKAGKVALARAGEVVRRRRRRRWIAPVRPRCVAVARFAIAKFAVVTRGSGRCG